MSEKSTDALASSVEDSSEPLPIKCAESSLESKDGRYSIELYPDRASHPNAWFFFKIDELRENPGATPLATKDDIWIPGTSENYNYRSGDGVSGQWWAHDGQKIYRIRDFSPEGNPYSCASMYYSAGRGFWVFRGDAVDHTAEGKWHPLKFNWTSSFTFLSHEGSEFTSRSRDSMNRWHRMLLPNIYHGAQGGQSDGLRGEIAIFLALIALSMQPSELTKSLPWMYQDGNWQVHNLPNGWNHKRGVVVKVYTGPKLSVEQFRCYEQGNYGCYYH
ncbi:hypothetical protein GQ44DRAFT_672498 [Phaeosphaeriaceae sp. PMI808]|nr:hypothetical protein GQ44DRAFT_672498 [Phaeosphaeriaceae sp. PMI808]